MLRLLFFLTAIILSFRENAFSETKVKQFEIRATDKVAGRVPALTNIDVVKTRLTFNPYGRYFEVELEFTPQGKEKLFILTKENLGKEIVLLLDGKVVMRPVIRDAIASGKLQISNNFSREAASELALSISSMADLSMNTPIPINGN